MKALKRKYKINPVGFAMLTIIAGSFLLARTCQAQETYESQDSRPELKEEADILDSIEQYVRKVDLPRIKNIVRTVQSAHQAINQDGMAAWDPMQKVQRVVMTCRYSKSFLESIKSEIISKKINRLFEITELLAVRHKFTKIQGANLIDMMETQMEWILEKQLIVNAPNAAIRTKLENIVSNYMGDGLSIARAHGDRPKAFRAAKELYFAFYALKNDLIAARSSEVFFSAVGEYSDMNEQLANYAEVTTQEMKEHRVLE